MFINQSLSHRVTGHESTDSAYVGFLDLDAGEFGMSLRVKAPGSGVELFQPDWETPQLGRELQRVGGAGRGEPRSSLSWILMVSQLNQLTDVLNQLQWLSSHACRQKELFGHMLSFLSGLTVVPLRAAMCSVSFIENRLHNSVTRDRERKMARVPSSCLLCAESILRHPKAFETVTPTKSYICHFAYT